MLIADCPRSDSDWSLAGNSADGASADRADVTLKDVLRRYADEVTPTKRSAAQEHYKISRLANEPLASTPLSDLTASRLEAYKDARLLQVSTGTVRQEMSLIRRAIDAARLAWGHQLSRNPVEHLTPIAPSPARSRKVSRSELHALLKALRDDPVASAAVKLTLSTGMPLRRLLALTWDEAEELSPTAKRPLHGLQGSGRDPVLPVQPHTLRRAWQRACDTVGINDLQLRDLTKGID